MAKLVRPNKLYLTGLYFRCLGVFAFQIQNFTFAEFKSSHKTSKGSRTRSSQESFSSVRIHQAENCSLSQQEGGVVPLPFSGWVWHIPEHRGVPRAARMEWNGMKYTKFMPEIQFPYRQQVEVFNFFKNLLSFFSESSWNADFGASEFAAEDEMEEVCTAHVFHVLLFLFPVQRNINVGFLPQA